LWGLNKKAGERNWQKIAVRAKIARHAELSIIRGMQDLTQAKIAPTRHPKLAPRKNRAP